jgi:hypothetical protein
VDLFNYFVFLCDWLRCALSATRLAADRVSEPPDGGITTKPNVSFSAGKQVEGSFCRQQVRKRTGSAQKKGGEAFSKQKKKSLSTIGGWEPRAHRGADSDAPVGDPRAGSHRLAVAVRAPDFAGRVRKGPIKRTWTLAYSWLR